MLHTCLSLRVSCILTLIYYEVWIFRWYINDSHFNLVKKIKKFTHHTGKNNKLIQISIGNLGYLIAKAFSHRFFSNLLVGKITLVQKVTLPGGEAAWPGQEPEPLAPRQSLHALASHTAPSEASAVLSWSLWLFFFSFPFKLACRLQLSFACFVFVERKSYSMCFFHSTSSLLCTVRERR